MKKGDFDRGLRALGVRPDGALLVHASFKSLGGVEGGLPAALDALSEYMARGLLLMPTHTWEYVCEKTDTFDVLNSPSCVGAMGEVFRHRPNVYRSLHPTHSMAGLGARARAFLAYDDQNVLTPCHPDGPWGRLREENAQILMLGVDLSKCTYFHCVEEMAGTPNRVAAETMNQYVVDYDGVRRLIPSYRHCYPSSEQFPRVHQALLACGAMREGTLGMARCLLVDARASADALIPMLRHDPGLFDTPEA